MQSGKYFLEGCTIWLRSYKYALVINGLLFRQLNSSSPNDPVANTLTPTVGVNNLAKIPSACWIMPEPESVNWTVIESKYRLVNRVYKPHPIEDSLRFLSNYLSIIYKYSLARARHPTCTSQLVYYKFCQTRLDSGWIALARGIISLSDHQPYNWRRRLTNVMIYSPPEGLCALLPGSKTSRFICECSRTPKHLIEAVIAKPDWHLTATQRNKEARCCQHRETTY